MSHTVCVQRAAVTAEACQPLMVNVKTGIKKYAAQVVRLAPACLYVLYFIFCPFDQFVTFYFLFSKCPPPHQFAVFFRI